MSRPAALLRDAYRRLFGGLLGTPVLYILGGALLGALAVPISAGLGGVPDLATVEVARSALPTIGGATLSLAGFVLTITTLSLQFGASTYSPRLVEHLRRDRLLGHTLGAALGTFSYSVVVLLAVRTSHPTAATVATLVAVAGATVDVLLFIALLERLIDSLRPGRVLSRQTSRALALAESVYPVDDTGTTGGETPGAEDGTGRLPDEAVVDWNALGTSEVIWRVGDAGHVVGLAAGALTAAACEHDAFVTLTLPVGAFVQTREAVAVVRDAGTGLPRPADPGLAARVLDAIAVGDERTVDDDPAYPLRLVVDIGLRALSPGVNDPTTAAQAIDHVEQILLALSGRRLGMQTLRDDDGVVRVQVPAPGWPALVRLGYVEIVAAGRDPQTRRALVRSVARLEARVPAHRRAAVRAVAELLERAPDSVG